MIHIIETHELPAQPKLQREIAEVIAARTKQRELFTELVIKLEALPMPERITEVMWFYWRDDHEIFHRVSILYNLLGLSQSDFRKLAADYQPSRVETCTICKVSPAVVKTNLDGSETPAHCEPCAKQKRKDDYHAMMQARPVLNPILITQTPDQMRLDHAVAQMRAVLRANPKGLTFEMLLTQFQNRFNKGNKLPCAYRMDFDKGFEKLRATELVAVSATPGGTSLWALVEKAA